MRISELAENLAEMSAEHGNVNVVVEHPQGYFNDPKIHFDGVDLVIALH